MSLSKEEQQQLVEELKGYIGSAEFRLDGHKINVQKVRANENRTALAVYIDGEIKYAHMGFSEESPAVVKKVWRKRERSVYPPSRVKKLEKEFG
ncbi:MAG: hypothetical protein B0D92_01815, partial [Spirochaeta sp. LUC14_002_19_P3]